MLNIRLNLPYLLVIKMITIRDSNNNQDHIVLDLGHETNGRSKVLTNQEAINLAEKILKKVKG